MLSWLATEAVRTQERELVLGDSLSGFMRQLGMVPTGGRWGSIPRLKEQAKRLFATSITGIYDDCHQTALVNQRIADQAHFWWDTKSPDQAGLWQSTVRLSEAFHEEVINHPVPVDLRAIHALKRSPLALDIQTPADWQLQSARLVGISMEMQRLLDEKTLTKYKLSQISGVPKTTIMDICSGKSKLEQYSAKTVYLLAKALGCSMESLLDIADCNSGYHGETGLPKDPGYFEYGLSNDLKTSIRRMEESWEIENSGGKDYHWDIAWCELNADINAAEVNQEITPEQAWYLREKYLRMKRDD